MLEVVDTVCTSGFFCCSDEYKKVNKNKPI